MDTTEPVDIMAKFSTVVEECALTFTYFLLLALAIIFSFAVGFAFGHLLRVIIQKILTNEKIEKVLVKYGAATTELWASMVNFVALYINILVAVLVVNMFIPLFMSSFLTSDVFASTQYQADMISKLPESMETLSTFMVSLLFLIISVIGGIILGGIAYKITKDSLIGLGLDRELWRHHKAGSVEGTSVSTILALIVKWFIVLLFLTTGVQMFLPSIQVGEQELALTDFMQGLLEYMPGAMRGFLILLVAVIISDFAGANIRLRRTPAGDIIPLGVEVVIIFLGAVLALEEFGFERVDVLSDSFKILMGGISLGIAIALGLGLKDRIAKEL